MTENINGQPINVSSAAACASRRIARVPKRRLTPSRLSSTTWTMSWSSALVAFLLKSHNLGSDETVD